MRYLFWIFLLLACCNVFGQNGYYVENSGDTVYCEFKKVFPGGLTVKTDKEGRKLIGAKDIKGFAKDGIVFVSKKIINQRKNAFVLLPGDKKDRKYNYSDPNLSMIFGNGLTFYELVEFSGAGQYGRDVTISLFIENDSLGLTKVPYTAGIGGVDKTKVIELLTPYLKSNEAIAQKLNANESWKTFNYKGIKKLMEEFTGKKMED
jgi:hypothetical protein